ncbi:MAG TPA: polysaccharide deacetylase [Rhizobium sp.]|nr:polysaccharide deacetylase [Rhizobium sp.]
MFRPVFLLSISLLSPAVASASEESPATTREPQLLLISFDGAGDNQLWAKSRELAARSKAHFTYFLSCTNLIPRKAAKSYQAPGHRPGKSNVGFAPTVEDVTGRLDHIWQAHLEGHEIASHACGHFDGKDWTKDDWLQEFSTFDTVLTNAWKAIGLGDREPEGWQDFVATGITGFRAPYLSATAALAEAEKTAGLFYDASLVTRGPQWPQRDGELTRFALPLIPEGPQDRRIVGMDYNLFVRHSAGLDDPARSIEFEQRAYKAFKAAFDAQYDGERIPLQLGFHFVEMNGGAYWRALDRLVSDVCNRADVACVGYSEAMDMLAKRPPAPRS